MPDDDICGEPTASGDSCKRTSGWGRDSNSGPCIDHTDDTGGTGRRTALEENPSITELVAGELQNGATIPEACAEANISTDQYFDWQRRGRRNDADGVFSKFSKETGRARRVDSREKRRRLWEESIAQGDIRTAYKLYHDQHGDTFDDEGGDGDAAAGIPLVVPDGARPD